MRKILVAEDEPMQRAMLKALLSKRFEATIDAVSNGKEAIYMVKESGNEYDIAILDINMPEINGLDSLDLIRQYAPELPVIMLTGSEDIENAVRAMKMGAYDYVKKPLDVEHFCVSIKNSLRLRDLDKELSRFKRNEEGVTKFSDLIGYNTGLANVVELGRKGAASEVPVMITGETGVGKELFARAIHGESNRVGKPFIAVNCGAIPSQLVESTLFGHEKGAFTGAVGKALGKFREAEGGTLFLDEVGELPLETQVKLLRAIQQKEVEPVGAGKPIKVDVRIISATNRDLQQRIQQGKFREDLYFRLDVYPIRVPPLRERLIDIKILANHFIESYSVINKVNLKKLSLESVKLLESYSWSGNVRELKNKVDRLMIISSGEVINADDVSNIENINNGKDYILNTSRFNQTSQLIQEGEKIDFFDINGNLKTLDKIESEIMTHALKHTGNNITKASELLGIAKSTFYRKAKNLNMIN